MQHVRDKGFRCSLLCGSKLLEGVGFNTVQNRSMAHLRYSSTTAWYYAFVIVSGLAFGGLTVWAAHQSSMYALRLTASNRFGAPT
eukprot:449514-Amphidinium_carterae.1